jgi:rRNA-processing protein FCF1
MIKKPQFRPDLRLEISSQFDILLSQFDHLERVLIDTSSILYMQKSGFLSDLSACLEISAISEVMDEVGEHVSGIRLWRHQYESKSTDQKLIEAALENGIPVVSEDRKILKTLEVKTIPFFNSLIMLNLLFYRRQINFAELKCFERNLRKYAWYSNKIWEYGGYLTQQILSRRNRTESSFG